MKIAKTLFASTAALGLVVAPLAAQAAPVRAATPVEQNQQLAGDANGTVLYVALAAFAIALIIYVASRNHHDHLPTSP
jgi:hypothetical protein